MQTTNKELRQFMNRAISALNHFEIVAAIEQIREYLDRHADAGMSDSLNVAEQTYRYMLHYMLEGQEDHDRPRLYSDLREDLYGIIRAIEFQENLKENPELYYSTARNVRFARRPLQSLLSRYRTLTDMLSFCQTGSERIKLLKERETTLRDIFDNIWTLPPGSKKDIETASAMARNKETNFMLASIIVAALTMGAMHTYDRDKLIALVDIDTDASQRLGARTLAGILLILNRHANRLKDDYTLRLRFDTWTDNLINYRRLREMIMVFIRTIGSLQLAEKMQNEVIPDLMKAGPDLMNKLQNGNSALDISDLEENPEWEELIEKSGLKEKLGKLERLQRDGADLMLMGVGRMKQMPFFTKMANWFLPFSLDQSDVSEVATESDRSLMETLDQLHILCDSDKYSFSLMLSQLPEAQRRQMNGALEAQQAQLSEEYKEALLHSSTPEFDREALSYVRSIYRFYNFFRLKNEFPSPFTFPFDFTSLPYLGSLLREREIVEMVAEFYFRNKHYREALPLFILLSEDVNEGAIYEKIGYCHLQNGNAAEALKYFEKAELLNTDSRWLRRNIARAAEQTGDFIKAADYYATQMEEDSDNINLLKGYATVLLKSGNFSDALKTLYKIDYLQPDNEEAGAMLTECRMRLGQFDKASERLESAIAGDLLSGDTTSWETLLMAAHAKMALGKIKEGTERYKRAMKSEDSGVATTQALRKRLEDDWEKYPSDRLDPAIIPLIVDATTI